MEILTGAAAAGDVEMCKEMLRDRSCRGNLCRTPLHTAAASGHEEVVCLLLDANASVNGGLAMNSRGRAATRVHRSPTSRSQGLAHEGSGARGPWGFPAEPSYKGPVVSQCHGPKPRLPGPNWNPHGCQTYAHGTQNGLDTDGPGRKQTCIHEVNGD